MCISLKVLRELFEVLFELINIIVRQISSLRKPVYLVLEGIRINAGLKLLRDHVDGHQAVKVVGIVVRSGCYLFKVRVVGHRLSELILVVGVEAKLA